MRPDWLPLLALIPAMIGPLPLAADTITARLCGGGTINIPVKRDRDDAPAHACSKACHAGACRKRSGKNGTLDAQ